MSVQPFVAAAAAADDDDDDDDAVATVIAQATPEPELFAVSE